VTVTIKDVADRAGVSVTSASYAINGKGTISEATRKRVLIAAEELNYHPNAFARNLKKQRSGTIGVSSADSVAFFMRIFWMGFMQQS
jgi:LacI family transcriptional regulator